MTKKPLSYEEQLNVLAARLFAAKQAEAEANAARVGVEAEIYSLVKANQLIPEKGSLTVGYITMTNKVATVWDQDQLAQLSEVIEDEHFPFAKEFKCDTRALNKLAVDYPAIYRKIFPAMTTRPQKPSFTLDKDFVAGLQAASSKQEKAA